MNRSWALVGAAAVAVWMGAVAAQAAKPINAKCPVKPADGVDPSITTTYKDKVIAFC